MLVFHCGRFFGADVKANAWRDRAAIVLSGTQQMAGVYLVPQSRKSNGREGKLKTITTAPPNTWTLKVWRCVMAGSGGPTI